MTNAQSVKSAWLSDQKLEAFLNGLGIRTRMVPECQLLKVSRDDMVRVGKGSWEQEHYDDILQNLQGLAPELRLIWGGKDDDYLYLESLKSLAAGK
jgi:hypothetical protein